MACALFELKTAFIELALHDIKQMESQGQSIKEISEYIETRVTQVESFSSHKMCCDLKKPVSSSNTKKGASAMV